MSSRSSAKASWAPRGREQICSGKVTVAECAALWIARHQQARLGYSQIKIVLNRLVARFGKDAIDSVDHRELDAWLRSLENFRRSTFTITSGSCVASSTIARIISKSIPRNPMSELQEPRLEHVDPEILTPEQMKLVSKLRLAIVA